jgi:hypothetical protein
MSKRNQSEETGIQRSVPKLIPGTLPYEYWPPSKLGCLLVLSANTLIIRDVIPDLGRARQMPIIMRSLRNVPEKKA